MLRSIFCARTAGAGVAAGMAADCPDHPGALGTARVLAIDPAATGPVGRKQFPATLPLEPNELVLTFDDGPWPGPTERVLAALKQECVRATFFMLGRNAAAHPALAKRVAADGHTVAHHSYAHKLLNTMRCRAPRPRSTLASRRWMPRPMASRAPARARRSSAFRALLRARRCWRCWPSAASPCSAPTYGGATGTGCRLAISARC